ncbi:MAG: type II secretion system GspH family protein [Victivallaceae bacterium]|nr:type II secretion system GspH family protein [Victivallaceae bacterium]
MRRIHSFTLVEILVVIAIIGILAGLVFPALNRARAVSQATTCLNNKRSLAQVANSYATDHNREIIFSFGSDKPYSLLFRGYTLSAYDTDDRPTGRVYMSFPAMRCPLAKIDSERKEELQVSAMFDVAKWLDTTIKGQTKAYKARYGDFRIDNRGDGVVYYSFRQMRSTSTLPLFADAFETASGKENPLSKTIWKFDEQGTDSFVALLHQDKATISYADGHADSQDKGGLEGMGFENKAFKTLN